MRVALIAHDRKKDDLVKFVKENESIFAGFDLVATRMTGMQILKKTALDIQCFDSGARGGDQEIGVLLHKGELSAVFFFRDLLTANSFEPDINTLPRLCDIYNIPIATNPESAKGILAYLKEGVADVTLSRKDSKVQVGHYTDGNGDHLEQAVKQNDRQKDGGVVQNPASRNEARSSKVQVRQNTDVNIDHLEQTSQLNDHLEDPLTKEVLTYIYETQKASALLLQLKFRMTSNRAAELIKKLESQGLIGPMKGNKPRKVLMTEEQYDELTSNF